MNLKNCFDGGFDVILFGFGGVKDFDRVCVIGNGE